MGLEAHRPRHQCHLRTSVTLNLYSLIIKWAKSLFLGDLMPDDLRWSWCNNNRVHNIVMHLNHPETIAPASMEELSSTKPAPGAKKVGNCCFRALVWKLSSISVTYFQHMARQAPHRCCSAFLSSKPTPLRSYSFGRHLDCSSTLLLSSPCSFWCGL